MEEEHEKTMSLRARRKKPSVGISCCFGGIMTQHHRRASLDATCCSSSPASHPSPRRSPSSWFKSKTNDLPEIKGKCRNFISRMARHRRHASADFSYDPLSYALNFDHDAPSAEDDSRALSFSARLPVSPPRRTSTPRSPEVAAERWKKTEEEEATPRTEAGTASERLRRGFEALSLSMKEPQKRSNKGAAAVAEVRESLEAEEVTPPVGIPPNRGILVQLC